MNENNSLTYVDRGQKEREKYYICKKTFNSMAFIKQLKTSPPPTLLDYIWQDIGYFEFIDHAQKYFDNHYDLDMFPFGHELISTIPVMVIRNLHPRVHVPYDKIKHLENVNVNLLFKKDWNTHEKKAYWKFEKFLPVTSSTL